MKKTIVKDNSGITLMALVITIIVILILATYATYSGMEAIENTEYTKFVAELKIVQTHINQWYEELKGDQFEENINNKFEGVGTNFVNLPDEEKTQASDSLNNSGIAETNYGNYYLLKSDGSNLPLGIEGVTQDVLISVKDRMVVSYLGLSYKNTMYYTLKDLGELYNVDYENKNNSDKPEITNVVGLLQIDDNSYKYIVDINYNATYVDKGTLLYRKVSEDENARWNSTENNYFLVSESGEYEIKVKDAAGNESDVVNKSNYEVLKFDREAGKEQSSTNRTLLGSEESEYSSKNPIIPQGFKAKDTEGAKWEYLNSSLKEVKGWNNGLVIEDDNGNQFVWVPCKLSTDTSNLTTSVIYEKSSSYPSNITQINDATDTNTIDDTTYSAIPVDETNQISKYGGFYVARYEAGISTTSSTQSEIENNTYEYTPLSKEGSKTWNFIDYEHSYVAAQKMINNSDIYGSTKSGLITGTQWDTIMKWYEESNIQIANNNQKWGTYENLSYKYEGSQDNSNFIATVLDLVETANDWQNGAFTHDSQIVHNYHASGLNKGGYQKNIADLGGNLEEWTAESGETDLRICRGGTASDSTEISPVSYRRGNLMSTANYNSGFRVVLYIE